VNLVDLVSRWLTPGGEHTTYQTSLLLLQGGACAVLGLMLLFAILFDGAQPQRRLQGARLRSPCQTTKRPVEVS
jgi:hypothetical protein